MGKPTWTLVAVASLGHTAAADSLAPAAAETYSESVTISASPRGAADDYLVMPSGGELSGQWKLLVADRTLDGQPLRFTDLALFGLTARYSLFSKLEIAGSVDFLPKQPSFMAEHAWQDVAIAVRSPLAKHVALAVSGAGGHLLSSTGSWTRDAIMLEWKKPICCDGEQWVAFDVQGGIDGLGLSAPGANDNAFLTEVAAQTGALFREPTGHWGAWIGIAYAVPVQHSGMDPTTMLPIDPQPRLDFHLGTVLSLEKTWDLFVDFAVINRGDPQNPQTELPILDGGFDQKQIVFGVARHIGGDHHRNHYDYAASRGNALPTPSGG